MPKRSKDWIAQAERDVENAQWELKGEFFEWACFSAQQGAEKAIKAVHQRLGGLAFGHSTRELLLGLKEQINPPNSLLEKASFLDKLYIPARYPNGWSALGGFS
jgi:HEPN domain-containing protein